MKIQLRQCSGYGDTQITDPDNAVVGILVEPGLSHHFDGYELSSYAGNVLSPPNNSTFRVTLAMRLWRCDKMLSKY